MCKQISFLNSDTETSNLYSEDGFVFTVLDTSNELYLIEFTEDKYRKRVLQSAIDSGTVSRKNLIGTLCMDESGVYAVTDKMQISDNGYYSIRYLFGATGIKKSSTIKSQSIYTPKGQLRKKYAEILASNIDKESVSIKATVTDDIRKEENSVSTKSENKKKPDHKSKSVVKSKDGVDYIVIDKVDGFNVVVYEIEFSDGLRKLVGEEELLKNKVRHRSLTGVQGKTYDGVRFYISKRLDTKTFLRFDDGTEDIITCRQYNKGHFYRDFRNHFMSVDGVPFKIKENVNNGVVVIEFEDGEFRTVTYDSVDRHAIYKDKLVGTNINANGKIASVVSIDNNYIYCMDAQFTTFMRISKKEFAENDVFIKRNDIVKVGSFYPCLDGFRYRVDKTRYSDTVMLLNSVGEGNYVSVRDLFNMIEPKAKWGSIVGQEVISQDGYHGIVSQICNPSAVGDEIFKSDFIIKYDDGAKIKYNFDNIKCGTLVRNKNSATKVIVPKKYQIAKNASDKILQWHGVSLDGLKFDVLDQGNTSKEWSDRIATIKFEDGFTANISVIKLSRPITYSSLRNKFQ